MTNAVDARPLRIVRTELEVAADVIMRLFDKGMLRNDPKVMRAVADITGVSIDALRNAKHRADARGYLAPADGCAITTVPATTAAGRPFRSEEKARSYAEGQRRGQANRSKQPPPDAETMRCPRCETDKPVDEFAIRGDRPHLRWTVCDVCRSSSQSNRYLSVAKRDALNSARLTFTISDDDESVGLVCTGCGVVFVPGDDVVTDAELRHLHCPGGTRP